MKIKRSESQSSKGPARGVTPLGGASSEAPTTGPDSHGKVEVGQVFTLYGFALLDDGRLHGCANRRIKRENGSKPLRQRWLAVTWPNTAAGFRAASDWSFDTSVRAHSRVAR